MDSYKKINGPINIIRLEGKIFGIKKILYLFFDKHFRVQEQTKCQDYLSDDVVVYLNREFRKIKDKNIDFFIETFHEYKSINDGYKNKYTDDDIYKDRYIDEVIKFFYKYIKHQDDKTTGTKISNHIRFHYVDIRNYVRKYTDNINDLTNLDKILIQGILQIKPFNKLNEAIKIIKKILNNIDILIKIINKPNLNFDDLEDKDLIKLNYIIDKIKNKYNHTELKKPINDLLNIFIKYLEDIKNNLIILDNNLHEILNVITNKYTIKIDIENILKESNKIVDNIYIDYIETFSKLMDIYFLRRILDKDYITHCVSYTGGAHSLEYIYFLVKNFDFTITHAAKIKGKYTLDKINSELKKNKSLNINYLWNIFLPNDDILQCSDLSTFPDNFN
jgi:hypothetical protein